MAEQKSTWDEVKQLAQELEVKMHLAQMDARDRWNNDLKPKVNQLEQQLSAAGKTVNDAVEKELASIGAALRRLRDEIKK
jgi:hypothetical protein